MTANAIERWRKLKPLLDRLLDLPADEREGFLAGLAGENAALRGDLERMLDAAGVAQGQDLFERYFAPSAFAQALGGQLDPFDERIGQALGRYRVGRPLGSGGMGAVYVAEREEGGFIQKVAIKIFKGSWLNADMRARFERERQILATLRHPHIASLLDGGDTPDGLPYYCMELVEGVNIAEHFRANVQSIEERIRLLLDVAGALAYAHQHLIVHRDIKPSNILVSADGDAKLVDFGIAKPIGPDDVTTMTHAAIGPMTPEYAAPEQFRGEAITVATDIFQFGTLCYQLLTGHLPYDADPSDRYAWSRAVSEEDPKPLQWAITREPEAMWSGRVNLARMKRQLRGDLSAILITALAKSPENRYRSMDAFIADLEAYLEGRPVVARGRGAAYHAWRFLSRRPYVSAGAAIALLGIIAASFIAMIQAQEARRESASVLAVTASLISLMQQADPDINHPRAFTAKALLAQSVESIEKNLSEQPASQATLLAAAGDIYMKLGDLPEGDEVLSRALSAFRQVGVGHSMPYCKALLAMAWIRYRERKMDDALTLLDEAERQLAGNDSKESRSARSGIWNYRGLIYGAKGELLEGKRDFEKAIAALGDASKTSIAVVRRNFAFILAALDEYDEAMSQTEQALSAFRAQHGDDHSRTASAAVTLASLRLDVGDIAGAVGLVSTIEPQYLKRFDEVNIELPLAELMYGNLSRAQHHYDDALGHFEQAEKTFDAKVGATHPYHAMPLYYEGLVEYERGHYEAALGYLQQTVEFREAVLPPLHPDLAQALDARALVLARLCRTRDALADTEKALQIQRATLPYHHSALVDSLRHEALLRYAVGEESRANELWAEARERAEGAYLYERKPELRAALNAEIADPSHAVASFLCGSSQMVESPVKHPRHL